MGCHDVDVVRQSVPAGERRSEVIIGEAADSHAADMVVISWEMVHYHNINANLLAEFVSCPVLLLP